MNDPEGGEVVFMKDNVSIHPTQYMSERVSGRLKLVKQDDSLFLVRIVLHFLLKCVVFIVMLDDCLLCDNLLMLVFHRCGFRTKGRTEIPGFRKEVKLYYYYLVVCCSYIVIVNTHIRGLQSVMNALNMSIP